MEKREPTPRSLRRLSAPSARKGGKDSVKDRAPLVLERRRPRILLALGWYSVAIHRGIARYARQANWILDLSMTRQSGAQAPARWNGDGIISLLHRESELCDFVRARTCPAVNIGGVKLPGVPTVRSDDTAVGRMAAEHFLARGFRHIAFCLRADIPSARERGAALRTAAEAAGASFHLLDWSESARRRPGSGSGDWLGERIARLPRPLAILAAPDEVGIEVMEVCIDKKLRVPEEIAILGIDNDTLRCDFAPVPLSSIDNNQEMEGYEAAALLDRLLRGERVPEGPLLVPPIGVVTRQSTDILAVTHPHVATALRHIWQNYPRPINAKTVAATVPISYRSLHDAFRASIGRSIAEEIEWKRLEKARALLAGTGLRLREIARECGFPSDARLCIVFRRELGMTPLDYRRRHRKRRSA